VVTCHDLHVFDIPWKYPNQQSVAQLFSDNMRTAKCILTHFPRTALHLPGHVDGLATPIVLTPSPAMLDTSRPDDAELAHARERFKITGAVPVLLYPAQLQQHKNHRNLFTALAKYTQQHAADRPPMLICPGSEFRPYHTEQLQRHAQELGIAEQVQMPGFVSDTELRSLYTLCDAVIAPSLAEGGAYIAYEAILFRKPVACSNLDSARMHLEMAHAQVPLFDPFEPAAIAQSIRLLLTQGGTLVARNELACRTINGWTFEMVAQHYLHEARACAGAAVTIPSA
jgi:glycosyltransferase involved in cell wall biosynthesis